MTELKRKRRQLRPNLSAAQLEERQVLSSVAVPYTPAPAPPPMSVLAVKMETARLRAAYVRQFKAADADLKAAVKADISQLPRTVRFRRHSK